MQPRFCRMRSVLCTVGFVILIVPSLPICGARTLSSGAEAVAQDLEHEPIPIFIEDAVEAHAKQSVHMIFGVSPRGELMSSDVPRKPYREHAPFDFPTQTALTSKVVASGAAAAGDTGGTGAMSGWRQTPVRIFVHRVPRCAGEELLEHYDSWDLRNDFGWKRALQLHSSHAGAVHRAILNSGAIVDKPEDATLFYVPAFFGLLVERWLDTQDKNALNCLAAAWDSLPDEIFLRNAGYDHFIVAGTCHPFSVCGTMECDVTTYHPFAGNVLVLTGGVREFGHPDAIFEPASVYSRLRHIFVPFPVTLDCARLHTVSSSEHARPLDVSFVGSENSRVRRYFRELLDDGRLPFQRNPRLFIRVLPDDQETARRNVLLGEGVFDAPTHTVATPRTVQELYAMSKLCLMLPGHIYDFGRRAFDFIAQGCVPVIVAQAPMAVALPFPGQLPWEDFAIFAHVTSVEDAASVLESLLVALATDEGKLRIAKRQRLLAEIAPRLFLPPHRNCPSDVGSGADSILHELSARLAAWTSLRTIRPLKSGVVSL
eukprot:TRINITY_DN74664_c0_g1_i1.p1 TRINITY_DN74664_c0_g1~~TRINITY_DN74664_c0_g1_i1.p1  ORF type:complete len:542 (+),score=58.90 TRINITY_DN74664_c0_g1_i1:201-1826(+)